MLLFFPFITDPQDLQEEGLEESVEEEVVCSSLMNILGFSDIFIVIPVLWKVWTQEPTFEIPVLLYWSAHSPKSAPFKYRIFRIWEKK